MRNKTKLHSHRLGDRVHSLERAWRVRTPCSRCFLFLCLRPHPRKDSKSQQRYLRCQTKGLIGSLSLYILIICWGHRRYSRNVITRALKFAFSGCRIHSSTRHLGSHCPGSVSGLRFHPYPRARAPPLQSNISTCIHVHRTVQTMVRSSTKKVCDVKVVLLDRHQDLAGSQV